MNMNFTDEQLSFLESSGHIVLCACPGSGKTTIIAQKIIKYLQTWNKPHRGIAVLSFTNVASDEINYQINKINPHSLNLSSQHFIGTLDSFINKYIFLRFGYLLLESNKRPKIIFSEDIVQNFKYWKYDCHKQCTQKIEDFRWNSDEELTRNGKPIKCDPHGKNILPCYQFKKMLFKQGLFFQNEVSDLTCQLLEKYPKIAEIIASRFPVIILDEAQDTSYEQMKILDYLCEAGLESIYIVGDPDQSIYEWRNASPKCFLNKLEDNKWKKIYLTKNFRNSQLICNATFVFSNIYKLNNQI